MNNGLKNEIDVYFQEIALYPLLSLNKTKELGRIIRNGNGQIKKEAIKELVKANLKLVVSIIKQRYLGRLNGKITFFDLIQAGNEGLLQATKRYDPMKHSTKFSSYASWRIRQEINLAIERQKEFPIRDVNHRTQLNQINQIRYEYFKENGSWPTAEWIAEKMGISMKIANKLFQIPRTIISLEKPVGNDHDSKLSDFIPDEHCLNPEEVALKTEEVAQKIELSKQTDKVLRSLSPRKEVVLRKRFAIGQERKHTLKEIGADFQVPVTRERIRKIEEEALWELRHHYKKRELLEDFVE